MQPRYSFYATQELLRVLCVVLASALCSCGVVLWHRTPDIAATAVALKIANAEKSFHERHGRYATLPELASEQRGQDAHALTLAARGVYEGHLFRLRAEQDHYELFVQPARWKVDGWRSLYIDDSKILRESLTPEPANARSPVVP